MNPQKKFQLIFSMVMAAMMAFLMTFIITLVNLGWVDYFFSAWLRSFLIAYVVATPVVFFVAPAARKVTARLLGVSL